MLEYSSGKPKAIRAHSRRLFIVDFLLIAKLRTKSYVLVESMVLSRKIVSFFALFCCPNLVHTFFEIIHFRNTMISLLTFPQLLLEKWLNKI